MQRFDILSQSEKGSPYSITERRVPELIPVLDSQPARDVSHKPGGRLPLLSARPAVNARPEHICFFTFSFLSLPIDKADSCHLLIAR